MNLLIPLDRVYGLALDSCILQEQRADLFASAKQRLQGVALETTAKVKRQAFEVNATTGQRLDVVVVDEGDSVEIDHFQVGRVGLDLAYVYCLVRFVRVVARLQSAFE